MWSFFWSVFSRIRTEYGEIRGIFPYSVRIRASTDQEKLRIWTLFTQRMMQRRSHREMFCKKGVLKNFTKFTGKDLCWSLFFNKVSSPRTSTLLNKRLQHRRFPVEFVKYLRTPFSLVAISGCTNISIVYVILPNVLT